MLEHFLVGSALLMATTVGYGDEVLTEAWRLLASFEAANAIILFGWTTAIIAALVQQLVHWRHGPETLTRPRPVHE
jgi:hypothetical protein